MADQRKPQIISARDTAPISLVETARVQTRTYLSSIHIRTAANLARQCAELETRSPRRIAAFRGGDLATRDQGYAAASVIICVAFMEAAANEFYNDCCDSGKDVTNRLGKQQVAPLAGRWKDAEKDQRSWPVLEHFQDALKILKLRPFERGRGIFQMARVLVDLRNFLVHYRTEWVGTDPPTSREKEAEDLEAALKKQRFSNNPFYAAGNAFLPDRCLGYGCAKWAVETSIEFVDEFWRRIGLSAKYEISRSELLLAPVGILPVK